MLTAHPLRKLIIRILHLFIIYGYQVNEFSTFEMLMGFIYDEFMQRIDFTVLPNSIHKVL
jgi:hypothetical protein